MYAVIFNRYAYLFKDYCVNDYSNNNNSSLLLYRKEQTSLCDCINTVSVLLLKLPCIT